MEIDFCLKVSGIEDNAENFYIFTKNIFRLFQKRNFRDEYEQNYIECSMVFVAELQEFLA